MERGSTFEGEIKSAVKSITLSQKVPPTIIPVLTNSSSRPLTSKIPRSCATHNGNFHADEVTACALLLCTETIDLDKIVRTRELAILDTAEFVVDVGGIYSARDRRFDHHQIQYTGSLSSAGMVLRYLRDVGKFTPEQFHALDEHLVQGVDDHDNGRAPHMRGVCTFSHIISNFAPINHLADAQELSTKFFDALELACGHIQRLLQRQKLVSQSRDLVRQAMASGKHYLVLDQSIPWIENFFSLSGQRHPACFVIMPSGEHWKLRGIPRFADQKMDLRLPLPLQWAGRMNADLQEVSGIPGALFCHKGRFISVWKTKQDAVNACELILRKGGILPEKNG